MTATTRFGASLSRHTAIYGFGSAIGLLLSLVNLAVLTRLLEPSEYGRLALLIVFSGLLTILLNLAVLRGMLSHVYGGGDEEVGDDGDGAAGARDRRRALTTALAIAVALAAVGSASVVVLATGVDRLVTGGTAGAAAVAWAGLSGGLGSIWRVVTNVLRMEARPVAFVVVNTLRPICVLALTIPLVAGGEGVTGAMAGLSLGTAVACALTLAITRRSYRLAISGEDARAILRVSGTTVPLVLGLWLIQEADLYVVSWFASEAEVGEFRVAARIGAVASYFVSAFMMAWAPLTRTGVYREVVAERGEDGVTGPLARYFVLAGGWLLVAVAGLSSGLVTIAGAAFGGGAGLIPLVAAGFVCYGLMFLIYRGARVPRKLLVYSLLIVTLSGGFFVLAIPLVEAIGAAGAPLAQIALFSAGAVAMLVLARRAGAPPRLDGPRLLAALALVVVSVVAAVVAQDRLDGVARWAAGVGLIALFPVAAVLVGALPRRELGALAVIARHVAFGGPRRPRRLLLEELPADDRRLLDTIVRLRYPVDRLAAARGEPLDELLADAVAALRRLGGLAGPGPADAQIGAWLFGQAADDDALWRAGADALEVEALWLVLDELLQVPPIRWLRLRQPRALAAAPDA